MKLAQDIIIKPIITEASLNVYDILNCDSLVVLKDAVTKIEEVYA